MKIKKNLKRFFTLSRGNEGFTLVELIVVIAILAILAGVAVPAYSGYITRANKQSDVSLAADIQHALILAMYSGELTDGDYVLVKPSGAAVAANSQDATVTTAAAAMTAAFGENWADNMQLKWDGWTVGVAGDADKMDRVNNSNFAPNQMESLLDQMQGVVGDAAAYLGGGSIQVSEEIAALLSQNGIEIEAGDTLDDSNSMAAANAYVYLVAGEMGQIDVQFDEEGQLTDDAMAFLMGWMACDFSSTNLDGVSKAAAKYASVLALAKYVDGAAGTTYENELNVSADPRDDADAVLAEIQASTEPAVVAAREAYIADTADDQPGPFYNDAMAFLTYMQGVSDSSGNLLQNTDLNNGQYFTDGFVQSYVNSYLSVGEVLSGANIQGNAMAFVYAGGNVVPMFSEGTK